MLEPKSLNFNAKPPQNRKLLAALQPMWDEYLPMNPRLPTSKKWTAFPGDFIEQIKGAFQENFPKELAKCSLSVDGRIYSQEIVLRVGFSEAGSIRQNNFEVSIDYKKDEAVDRIHDAIDIAASMMADYIEAEGEIDFPKEWQEFEFENLKVFCRHSTVNTKLENEADRILGLSDDSLVHEEESEEDKTSHADPDEPPKDKSKLH